MEMTTNNLIQSIVALEFQMFQAVVNKGGRASCQDDPETFEIMRTSQFSVWSQTTLESYYQDLLAASVAHRNLLAEKYAWMMQQTFPAEFERLRGSLEPLSREKNALVEMIMAIQSEMTVAMYRQYPATCACGRPLRQDPSHPGDTSSLVYLRGELHTYSIRTLSAYFSHLKTMQQAGRNLPVEILENTAKRYGYKSLAAREAACRRQ